MSMAQIISILYPIIIIALSIFIVFRLKIGRAQNAAGSGFVYAGLVLIFASSLINLLTQHPDYSFWFLAGVYPIIDLSIFLFLIAGAILFLIGLALFFSFWGDRDIEVANHLEKLKLLDNIQQESRYPQPLPELLDRALKSILGGMGEEAGAVFLLNRTQRKFVLVTGVGLTKEETTLLEYYPYGRNIITQAIEDESPMVSSDFRSLGGKAQLAVSKFRSILVMPMISGRNRLGALIFFSTEGRHYSREYISIISPICEWLSEKIEVSRLGRDMKKSSAEFEAKSRQLDDFFRKLGNILKFEGEIPSPSEFAGRCVGFISCEEVWLLGLVNGKLSFYGGSESVADFSENFKTAMINSLAQNKAVILNQESTDEAGNSFISRSTLLLPADNKGNAIMLRKSGGAISVDDEELHALEMIADVAGMVIYHSSTRTVSLSRSRGLETLAGVLHSTISKSHPGKDIRSFTEKIREIISDKTVLLLFRRNGKHYEVISSNVESEVLNELSIAIGEGSTGRTAVLRSEAAFFDARTVADNLAQYDEENRNCLFQIFEEKKTPAFQADYPILLNNNIEFIVTLFGFKESPSENMELHRLISLLVALLNLRIEITFAPAFVKGATPVVPEKNLFGEKINEINNSLSAISGFCQLGARDPNISGKAVAAFDSILAQTEELADSLNRFVSEKQIQQADSEQPADPRGTIRDVFEKNSISGNLHMIEGKPYSVNLDLHDVPVINVRRGDFANFVNNAAGAFAENVDEDEIISVSTYSRDGFTYLDISKHRENFPPVEAVAGFGNYLQPQAAKNQFKNPGFLRVLESLSGEFAFDRHSRKPSYYSFRFPQSYKSLPPKSVTRIDAPNILAVDDQAVILDLLAGMCQSLGYGILTARDGDEGLKVFEDHRPDIVITDLAMPRMSGWELASRIKVISPETPIILITGWGVSVDEENMKRAGVDFILRKPFRLEQLSEMITKIRFSRIN